MKKLLFTTLFSSILLLGFTNTFNVKPIKTDKSSVQDKQIKFFAGSWEEAKNLADKEDKLIFLNAMASWCGFCKVLKRDTFTDSKVVQFFNDHFINYEMNMERDPNGARLSKKYGLKGYPSLYFVDKNEELIHSGEGNMSARDLIKLGQAALNH